MRTCHTRRAVPGIVVAAALLAIGFQAVRVHATPPLIPADTPSGFYFIGIILNLSDWDVTNNASNGQEAASVAIMCPPSDPPTYVGPYQDGACLPVDLIFDWNAEGELSAWIDQDNLADQRRKELGLPTVEEATEKARRDADRKGVRPPDDIDEYHRKRRQWAREVGWLRDS